MFSNVFTCQQSVTIQGLSCVRLICCIRDERVASFCQTSRRHPVRLRVWIDGRGTRCLCDRGSEARRLNVRLFRILLLTPPMGDPGTRPLPRGNRVHLCWSTRLWRLRGGLQASPCHPHQTRRACVRAVSGVSRLAVWEDAKTFQTMQTGTCSA